MLGFMIVLHVLLAALLIVVILMQQSHGSGMSSVFGGGGSGSFFGGRGASPLLLKITIGLAIIFFVTSASIALIVPKQTKPEGINKELQRALPANRGIPMEGITGEATEEEKGANVPTLPVGKGFPEFPTQEEGGGK